MYSSNVLIQAKYMERKKLEDSLRSFNLEVQVQMTKIKIIMLMVTFERDYDTYRAVSFAYKSNIWDVGLNVDAIGSKIF